MKRLARVAPIAVTLLLVAGVAWFATRSSGKPGAAESPSPSPSGPCQLDAPSPTPGGVITTPEWTIRVAEVRSSASLPAQGSGVYHAETGKLFVVGRLRFTRVGSAEASVNSDDVSIDCSDGGSVKPGYWSEDGKGFCFPCSFDLSTGDRSTSFWFAFKVDEPRAAFSFAVRYAGFGPVAMAP